MHIDSAYLEKFLEPVYQFGCCFSPMGPKNRALLYPPDKVPLASTETHFFSVKFIQVWALKCLPLSQDLPLSHEKTCSSYIPNPQYSYLYVSNMQQVTIQKKLDPVYTWFKTINFYIQLVIYWGESGLLLKFYLFIISVEKK